MKKLFNMIENRNSLNVDDLVTVVEKFDYYIPKDKANAFIDEINKVLRKYSLTPDVMTFNDDFDPSINEEILTILNKYYDNDFFETIKDGFKDKMFDSSNCYLNKMFKTCKHEHLVALLTIILRLRRHTHVFMTHNNFLNFWSEVIQECRKVDPSVKEDVKLDFFDYLCVPPINFWVLDDDLIKNLILKYLDLNVILTDNTMEAIMSENPEKPDSCFEETICRGINHVLRTLTLHNQLRYKARVLM